MGDLESVDGRKRIRRVKIFFDGGCRPNPGRMEAAIVLRGETRFYDDLGYGTSNDAEWIALHLALQIAHTLGETDFELIGDGANVIRQANGLSKCRTEAACRHYAAYQARAAAAPPQRVRWISRNQNLAGIALARRRSRI